MLTAFWRQGDNSFLFGRFIRSPILEIKQADDVVLMNASPQKLLSKMPVWSTGAQAVRSCILPHKQLELAVTAVVDCS